MPAMARPMPKTEPMIKAVIKRVMIDPRR